MNSKKIKIVFALPTLKAGGAERVLSFLAQNIDNTKFEAHLLIIGKEEESYYDIQGTAISFLNKSRVRFSLFQVYWFLIKIKPAIVLSSIGHLNTIMAVLSPLFPKTKFVIREASVLSYMSQFSAKGNIIGANLAKWTYPWVDGVVCQSKDMASDFMELFNIKEKNLYTINNPISTVIPRFSEGQISQYHNLITVGRLSKEKGHARILNILASLKRDFRYTIIGDGPEKENIYSLIRQLRLESKIQHITFTDKVNDYLSANDLFLQGSYVEGFPNAVLESCVMGTPVLAFDVPGGTKEIIVNGLNGYLARDEEEYLDRLVHQHFWNRKEVSSSVFDKFHPDKILSEYEDLFNKLIT